jgi:hypothetical protein
METVYRRVVVWILIRKFEVVKNDPDPGQFHLLFENA